MRVPGEVRERLVGMVLLEMRARPPAATARSRTIARKRAVRRRAMSHWMRLGDDQVPGRHRHRRSRTTSIALPTASVWARNAAMPTACVGSMVQLSRVKYDRDQHPRRDRLVALARGHESPALDGVERGVVEARRAAARAQLHLSAVPLGVDQHAQHHPALLAHAARERRIGGRRVVEVGGVEVGRDRGQCRRRRRGWRRLLDRRQRLHRLGDWCFKGGRSFRGDREQRCGLGRSRWCRLCTPGSGLAFGRFFDDRRHDVVHHDGRGVEHRLTHRCVTQRDASTAISGRCHRNAEMLNYVCADFDACKARS